MVKSGNCQHIMVLIQSKLLTIYQYGMPTVQNQSIWDGLIHPHIRSYAPVLAVRIDMFRQLRHYKKKRQKHYEGFEDKAFLRE